MRHQSGDEVLTMNATIKTTINKLKYILLLLAALQLSCNAVSRMVEEQWDDTFTLTVTPADKQLAISWSPVAGAISYEVYYNTTPGTASAAHCGENITASYFILTGLENGTTYYIWLRINTESGTTGFGTPVTGMPVAPVSPPDRPDDVTATPGDTQLFLNWSAVPGAISYELWYNTSEDTASAVQTGGVITGLSYTITSLVNGTKYFIWLRAVNSLGTSGYSSIYDGTPAAAEAPPEMPGPPVITPGISQLSLNWTAVPDAVYYEVWYSTTASIMNATRSGGNITGTEHTITSLTGGITYYVWLRAVNSAGKSQYSMYATGTPYYASSGASYTVTFNSNGGTSTVNSISVFSPATTVGSLPSAVRAGYDFIGWYTAINGGTEFTASTTVSSNITVYAIWSTPGLVFTLINGGTEYSVTTGSFDPATGNATVPAYYAGKRVTAIGDSAFTGYVNLISLTLPESITSIGDNAFKDCQALSALTLPGSLTTLGNSAFTYCYSLTSVTIPGSLTAVGSYVFANCNSLTNITFENGVTVIGVNMFYSCINLTSVTIPATVATIGDSAFANCNALMSVLLYPVTPPSLGLNVFLNCSSFVPGSIKVPSAGYPIYITTGNWVAYSGLGYITSF